MANQLSTNPWIITDTSQNVLFPGNMVHVQIEYVDYKNPGDSVEVQDRFGRLVARLKGTADLQTVRMGRLVGWVYGFKVPPVDSDGATNMPTGKLICYFD